MNTGNYGNHGNLGGEWGLEWCMYGRSDEQDIDYYGNLGNPGCARAFHFPIPRV